MRAPTKTIITKIVYNLSTGELCEIFKKAGMVPEEWDGYSPTIESGPDNQTAKVTLTRIEPVPNPPPPPFVPASRPEDF